MFTFLSSFTISVSSNVFIVAVSQNRHFIKTENNAVKSKRLKFSSAVLLQPLLCSVDRRLYGEVKRFSRIYSHSHRRCQNHAHTRARPICGLYVNYCIYSTCNWSVIKTDFIQLRKHSKIIFFFFKSFFK